MPRRKRSATQSDDAGSFAYHRKRLLHTKHVWNDKGLLGTGESVMRTLISMYRGEQWEEGGWRGLSSEELLVVNKIFPFANQQQAGIISSNPRTLYTARKKAHEQAAPAVQALHDYDIREQNHKRQLKAAFRTHQFAPFGCIRHGYTPPEEIETEAGRRISFFRNANPNRPWLRSVLPWNVLFDTEIDDLSMDGGMKWVAFRDRVLKSELRDNPNVTMDRDALGKLDGERDIEYENLRDLRVPGSEDPDEEQRIDVWTVYEIEERTFFQMTIDGSDDYIRKPADWPIPWEWLPANFFCVNEQLDTPLALAMMEEMAPQQREYNQVRTMIHQGVLRSRKINLYNKLAMGDDETATRAALAENAEWIGVDGDPRLAVNALQTGGLPQESLQHLGVIDGEMRETNAQSKMKRGERVNVESGTEAQGILMGQEEAEFRTEDIFAEFVRDVESQYMVGRRFIMATVGDAATEVVRVVGAENGQKVVSYATVDANVLHGEYDFEIEVGSMRPANRNAEAQNALIDLDAALKVPNVANVAYFFESYVSKRGHNPSQAMLPDAAQAAQAEAAGANMAAMMGQPQKRAGVDANVVTAMADARGGRR